MQCGKSVFDLISIEVRLTVVGKEWEMKIFKIIFMGCLLGGFAGENSLLLG